MPYEDSQQVVLRRAQTPCRLERDSTRRVCARQTGLREILCTHYAANRENQGSTLPSEVLAPDVIASLIRMSGGNFRLLTRLLTQIERILKVNQLDKVSKEIVAAARDSLVIGQV
jgi:hypothetical protein